MTQWEAIAINLAWGISLWVILEYFGMSQETLIILTSMLILDWIFWVANAYMHDKLQSKLMWKGLFNKWLRWCFPFIVIAIIRWAGFDNAELTSTVIMSIMIVAEGYSVIGHIYSMNYDEQLPEIDALKKLIEWVSTLFKGKIEDTLPKEEEQWKKTDNTEL